MDTTGLSTTNKDIIVQEANGCLPETVADDRPPESGDLKPSDDRLTKIVVAVQAKVAEFWTLYGAKILFGLKIIACLCFHAYLIAALAINFQRAVGLLVLTVLAWMLFLYICLFQPWYHKRTKLPKSARPNLRMAKAKTFAVEHQVSLRIGAYLSFLVAILLFLAIDARQNRYRFFSFLGLLGYIFFMYVTSRNPAMVNWRTLWSGVFLQFLFGLLVLRWQTGFIAFSWISNQITTFLNYVEVGTSFVYGFIAAPPPGICGMTPVFAFSVLQTIIFFGAVVSILFYLGAMQFIVKHVGGAMQ